MSDYTHGEYEISDSQKKYYTPTTELIRLEYSRRGISRKFREEIFDRWLAEVKAEAWAEGASAGCMCSVAEPPNPYRQGEEQ